MAENLGLQVEVGANIKPLTKGLADARKELATTAAAAQKTDSSLVKMGGGLSTAGNLAKSAASNISSLAGSLISGGLITAVAFAGAALFELGKKIFDVSEQQKRLNDVLEGSKSAYVKAVLEVDKVREAFKSAKDGIISKEKALQVYNSTIGKTIGQTNNLGIAEKNFIANAENYIKYTFLKAAANIALGKAAEAAFRAELERGKEVKKPSFLKLMFTPGQGSAANDKQRKINKQLEEQNSFIEIYNRLKEQYNALGFMGIEQGEKEVVVIKKKTAATKEYINEMKRLWQVQSEGAGMWNAPFIDTIATISPEMVIKPRITIDSAAAGLDTSFSKFSEEVIAKAQVFSEMVAVTIESTFTDAFSGIGEALGRALSGEKNAVPNLFGSLMQSVGSQLQELGKFLIKSAITVKIAKEAFQKLLANPIAAVAVGIGLVALGALLKSQAAKQYKGFATGVRNFEGGVALVGERGPELVNLPRGSGVIPNNEMNAYGGGGSVFIPAVSLRGSDLVIAFNRASQSMSRNG